MEKKSLKLNAVSQNDLQVMSAHLQDSITQIKNIAHLKKNRIFLRSWSHCTETSNDQLRRTLFKVDYVQPSFSTQA